MANVVFYIRTKFIKIEEKKKVVNIVKNRNIKYRNIFLMITSRTIVKKILHF